MDCFKPFSKTCTMLMYHVSICEFSFVVNDLDKSYHPHARMTLDNSDEPWSSCMEVCTSRFAGSSSNLYLRTTAGVIDSKAHYVEIEVSAVLR